jgi:hypothetical protein
MKPDLQAIRERAEKATPGPWYLVNSNQIHDRETKFNDYGVRIGETPNLIAVEKHPNGSFNTQFIAHARQDIPALLAYIAELGAAQQWISCRDRLPKSGQPIDVWIVEEGFGRRSIDAEYDAEERLFDTDEGDYEADDGTEIDGIVTHWMERPADPQILLPLPAGRG